ncbi:MAG: tail fiber protein [Bacteroidota bacterium]
MTTTTPLTRWLVGLAIIPYLIGGFVLFTGGMVSPEEPTPAHVPAEAAYTDGFIGEVRLFAGNFAPRNWAFCDGALLPISSYSALFSLLGTTYGGDGRTTFALPDLRGRVAVHEGQGPGLTNRPLGSKWGTENITLNVNQLPAHTHTAKAEMRVNPAEGTTTNPTRQYLAKPANETPMYHGEAGRTSLGSKSVTVKIGNAGGGQQVPVTQPSLSMNYIICLTGVYPSRN